LNLYLQNILAPEQFEIYKGLREEQIHLNQKQLIQRDNEYLNQLEASKALLEYYQK
jgi:hypothetical protein